MVFVSIFALFGYVDTHMHLCSNTQQYMAISTGQSWTRENKQLVLFWPRQEHRPHMVHTNSELGYAEEV